LLYTCKFADPHVPSIASLTEETQLFRLWLGITEYLFRNPELLEEVIDTAINDNTFRRDDLEFTFAARVRIFFPLSLILLLFLG
jgi:hypothetical protein